MTIKPKVLRDRARYNSIADLADRYPGEYSVLYAGWRDHFSPSITAPETLRDKAKHAARADLLDNHRSEYSRLYWSWIRHYERQYEIQLAGKPTLRDASGRFSPN